jgi:hypothetical protein
MVPTGEDEIMGGRVPGVALAVGMQHPSAVLIGIKPERLCGIAESQPVRFDPRL